MTIQARTAVVEPVKSDITLQKVNGTVNAANRGRSGGGRVDRAIHEAGAPPTVADLKRKFPSECELTNEWL